MGNLYVRHKPIYRTIIDVKIYIFNTEIVTFFGLKFCRTQTHILLYISLSKKKDL